MLSFLSIFKRIPLSLYIFFGLILGIVFGFLCIYFKIENFVLNWIAPLGIAFLNLLKLIAIPIVFFSVICGIFSLGSVKDFSSLAIKSISLFIITTLFAVLFGLILANTLKPGKAFKDENKVISKNLAQTKPIDLTESNEIKKPFFQRFLQNIISDNIFQSFTDNTKMLQIIFIAILFGIGILFLPYEKTSGIRELFHQFNEVFIFLVGLIMKFSPIGVFAIMSKNIIDFGGDESILKALGLYAITVTIGLLTIAYIIYPLIIKIFTTIKLKDFFKAVYPIQIVAFSSSSSAVTLPVTKRQVENELKIPEKISGFVLPLGMTINMDGTSLYQVVAVVFISQVYGINLTIEQQLSLIFLALLSSIGAPGIPGGSMVFLTLILSSVHLPVEGLALILAVDRPLDMLRTVTNVTGDTVICSILSKSKLFYSTKKT